MADDPIETGNPSAWAAELREGRRKILAGLSPDIAMFFKHHCPNITRVRLAALFDDGMEIAGELEIIGVLTQEEVLKRFPEAAAALEAGGAVHMPGGYSLKSFNRGGPKRSKKRWRKNPGAYPVEKPPKKGGPQ
jgi:hypothetical protein